MGYRYGIKKQEPCSQGAHLLGPDNRLRNKQINTSGVQRPAKNINQRDTRRVAPLDGRGRGTSLRGRPWSWETKDEGPAGEEPGTNAPERGKKSAKACPQAPESPACPCHAFLSSAIEPETSILRPGCLHIWPQSLFRVLLMPIPLSLQPLKALRFADNHTKNANTIMWYHFHLGYLGDEKKNTKTGETPVKTCLICCRWDGKMLTALKATRKYLSKATYNVIPLKPVILFEGRSWEIT